MEERLGCICISGVSSVQNPGILNSGLEQHIIDEVFASLEGKTPSAKDYLKRRRNPIFVIYPIDLKVDVNESSKSEIKRQLGDSFLIGIGKFLLEFAKTLVIDTVIQAILSPYNNQRRNTTIRGNFVCL